MYKGHEHGKGRWRWWSTIRSRCRCLLGWGCVTVGCGLHAQTLSEVVQHALRTYPAVISAQSRLDAARADVGRARSAHYPQLSWGWSANAFQSGSVPSTLGSKTSSPAIKVNLWSGGRIEADVDRSESLVLSNEAQRRVADNDLALQVTEAYLSWVKNADLQRLAERNLNDHQETLAMVQKIVEVDSGRNIDLTQAQVRVDNARLALQQYRTELQKAQTRLKRYWPSSLSLPPLDASATASSEGVLEDVPQKLEIALTPLTDDLPSLSQYRAQVEAAQAAVRQVKGLYWPTVDLTSSRQFNANLQRFDTFTQLQVSMPLYDGRNVDHQVVAAQAQLQAAQAALDEARRGQEEKIILAWQEWMNARHRSALGEAQSSMGDHMVEGYRWQFRLARRSLLDLLNIQSDVFQYRSNAMAARHDEALARARLLGAMGALAQRFVRDDHDKP